MTDTSAAADDGRADRGEAAGERDVAEERFGDLMRVPRTTALTAGVGIVPMVALMFFVSDIHSGLMVAFGVGAALLCVFAVWNLTHFTRGAVDRLERLAPQVNGRFTLWEPGAGGYDGVPFAYTVEHQRFGELDLTVHGTRIEIGHLVAQASSTRQISMGQRYGYIVFRLPERLPHMIVSFGHLSKFMGVRLMPEQWHRSQRVDVGGRRFRLYVGEGGEDVARRFFTPEVVQLFRRIGRTYDIEIKGRDLYLFSRTSPAAGSARRWKAQQELVERVAAALRGSEAWDLVRRQSSGRGPSWSDIRPDIARGVTIIMSVVVVAIVVLSFVALKAAGFLD